MRCYFMKSGHITAVEFLQGDNDEDRIRQAMGLFEEKGKLAGAEGFEVWDGPRFVYRFPPGLQTPQPRPRKA